MSQGGHIVKPDGARKTWAVMYRDADGLVGLGSAEAFTVDAVFSPDRYVGLAFLALSYASSDLMLPIA
jgi:hypothetical protein